MMAIGNYFAFIIIVMGTLLAAHDFNDKEKRQFFQDILNAHNNYRKEHDSAKLILSNRMCKTAKDIVKKWIKNSNTMAIPDKYKANYVYISREFDDISVPDANIILENWYANEAAYDYFEETLPTKETDQFTQIVWKSTKEIGVEIIRKDNVVLVLVIYSPAGNQEGQYLSNVLNPQELTWEKVELHDNDKKQFAHGILIAHNTYRKNHNSPNLVLEKKLNEVAEKRVKEWNAYRTNTLHDDYEANYIQMPFECMSKLEPETIVSFWYDSGKYYDYTKEPLLPAETNPFTQVVWKSTQAIGVGILIINGIVNVVVIYSPAGNKPGQYTLNVGSIINNNTEADQMMPEFMYNFLQDGMWEGVHRVKGPSNNS